MAVPPYSDEAASLITLAPQEEVKVEAAAT
jgi:hypothetical protein